MTVGPYTLELTPDPDMKVSELRAGAEDIEMLERRVLGRADGLNDDIDSGAKEFTEVIKWDITGLSEEDLAVWMEVSSSLRFCAGITQEWADCVSEYKRERQRIINHWNDIAPTYEADLSKGPSGFVWQKNPSEKAAEALMELKEEAELEEATAYNTLYTRSEELRDDLTDGPTPEAVQRLIDGGYSTWAYFNLGGDIESIPIDADPEEMADTVADFAANPEVYEGNINEVYAILNNMALVAVERKENGGTLTREELDFLNEFYKSLEEAGGEGGQPPGVLNISEQIIYNAEIDQDTKDLILGGLGGGILVLSDESLLGGYDNIPQSIRDVAEGPYRNDPPSSEWKSNAATLGAMFRNTNAYIQGGEEFSVNLTQSLGYALDGAAEDYPYLASWWLENLIDVSTRNEDSNHALLTGEGQYEHPRHGLDPEMTLRSLYTYDWDDDGQAVSGITDWIVGATEGDYWEKERADEAMASYIELFGDPAFMDALSGTGYEVSGQITNDKGELVDTTWSNASAGHVNPEMAMAWADLFVTYIDEFSSGYGLPIGSTGAPNGQDTHIGEDGTLFLNPDDRTNFIQQVMGDGNAASRVHAETVNFNFEKINDFTQDQSLHPGGAIESGILRGMVDEALSREAEVRTDKNKEDKDYQQRVANNATDLLGSAISEIPIHGSSVASETIKISIKENLDFESHIAEINTENSLGAWELEENYKLLLLAGLDSDDPRMDRLPPNLIQEENGERTVPLDPEKWNVEKMGDEHAALSLAWQEIYHTQWGDSEFDHNTAMGEYANAYENAREKVKEEHYSINN